MDIIYQFPIAFQVFSLNSFSIRRFQLVKHFTFYNWFTFIPYFYRGLSIHTFHGNFFVRSTDLLSLPNASPDAGFGMQVSIDENLTEVQNVCFQAALLYTSSKGKLNLESTCSCYKICYQLLKIWTRPNCFDFVFCLKQNCTPLKNQIWSFYSFLIIM